MGKQGQCGVYRLYKLSKGTGNTFSNEFKKVERDLHVVTHGYADLINQNSVINGSLYEYDEYADDLYWSGKDFKNSGIVTVKTIEEVDKEIKEANGLTDLRDEYTRLSDKKAHHLWQEARLIEEIEKLKN